MKKLLYITSLLVIFFGVDSLQRQNVEFTLKYNQTTDQSKVNSFPNAAAPSITYAPDTTYQELDTTIIMDVMTNDDNSMEADSTLKYSLLGIDSALFKIDSITGQIRFVNPPDFENALDDGMDNIYNITIVVCDNENAILCDMQTVAITVTDYEQEGTLFTACGQDIDWVVELGTNGSYQMDIGGTGPTSYGTGWWLGQGAFAFNNTGSGGEVTLTFDNPVTNLELYLQAQQSDDVVTFSVPAQNVVQEQSPAHPTAGIPTLSVDGITLNSSAPNDGADWGIDTRVFFGNQAITTITISSSQGYNGTVLRAFDVNGASAISCPPIITYAPDTIFYSGSSNIIMDVMSTDDNNSENDSTLSYTLSGLDSPLFVIDSFTGELTFITPPTRVNPQDNGKNNIYDLTVIVCDAAIPILCDSQAVTITIIQDTDGDGVADINDLDDDNDGILDEDECEVINIAFALNPAISDSSQLIYESTINGITETVTLTASTNPTSLINPNGVQESNGAILSIDGNNAIIKLTDNDSLESALTFTSTYPIKTIQFDDLDDMDRKVGDLPSDAYGFTTSGKWQVITGNLATYNSATGQLEVNNPTNNAEANLAITEDASFEMLTKNNQSGILIRGTIGETNNAEAHFVADAPFYKTDFLNEDLSLMGARELVTSSFNIQFITLGVADCDIDNDGIFSQFDLDSDGDGCADALEAGHGIVMQADSTIAGPYGNNGLATSVENDDSETATINYTIQETNLGTYDFIDGSIKFGCEQDAVLMLKVMLHGALIGTSDGLMRDDLRSQNFIPLQQPYTEFFNNTNRFKHLGGGTEVTTNTILNANAGTPDAIVDWIFVELRDSTNAKKVIRTISALVQRDGDIVDAASGLPLLLTNPPASSFVSIKHRNHLGAMKKEPVLMQNDTIRVDFVTMPLTDFYADSGFDTLAVTTIDGKRALWAGNANKDKKPKYTGGQNDQVIINNDIMSDPNNTELKLNFAHTMGYFQGDVNLDGNVKYDGQDNDRIIIQNIILTYPLNFNGLNINNFNNFLEQLP